MKIEYIITIAIAAVVLFVRWMKSRKSGAGIEEFFGAIPKQVPKAVGTMFRSTLLRLVVLYSAVVWMMYHYLPDIIITHWGVGRRSALVMLVIVGYFAIPALWVLFAPAGLPGDAKIVRRGYKGVAIGVLAFIAWTYWVQAAPTRLFDNQGNSLFWVDEDGAKAYFAPGTNPLTGIPLRQGTKEDAKRIKAKKNTTTSNGTWGGPFGENSLMAKIDERLTVFNVDTRILHPVWQLRWKLVKPAPGGDQNPRTRGRWTVVIDEYAPRGNGLGFIKIAFSPVWKSRSDNKNRRRALWTWDKVASPERGSWEQNGDPDNPDGGDWWGLTFNRDTDEFEGGFFTDEAGAIYSFRLVKNPIQINPFAHLLGRG